MSHLPPSVPQDLRELLKDYPEHIERLQEVLTGLMVNPTHGVGLFDQAIWVLESRLGVFVSEAQDELNAAKRTGDVAVIEQAKKKDFAVGCARLEVGDLFELEDFLKDRAQS